jgi:hypothetical protein
VANKPKRAAKKLIGGKKVEKKQTLTVVGKMLSRMPVE